MYGYPIQLSIEPGKTSSVTFTVEKEGVHPYYCTEFCSALHLEMMGYMMVQPSDEASSGSNSN
jgi:nitrous-oxide reductase